MYFQYVRLTSCSLVKQCPEKSALKYVSFFLQCPKVLCYISLKKKTAICKTAKSSYRFCVHISHLSLSGIGSLVFLLTLSCYLNVVSPGHTKCCDANKMLIAHPQSRSKKGKYLPRYAYELLQCVQHYSINLRHHAQHPSISSNQLSLPHIPNWGLVHKSTHWWTNISHN